MSKEGLLRLSGRDSKKAKKISVKESKKAWEWLCALPPAPLLEKREGWGRGDWGDWIYRSMEETAVMRIRSSGIFRSLDTPEAVGNVRFRKIWANFRRTSSENMIQCVLTLYGGTCSVGPEKYTQLSLYNYIRFPCSSLSFLVPITLVCVQIYLAFDYIQHSKLLLLFT